MHETETGFSWCEICPLQAETARSTIKSDWVAGGASQRALSGNVRCCAQHARVSRSLAVARAVPHLRAYCRGISADDRRRRGRHQAGIEAARPVCCGPRVCPSVQSSPPCAPPLWCRPQWRQSRLPGPQQSNSHALRPTLLRSSRAASRQRASTGAHDFSIRDLSNHESLPSGFSSRRTVAPHVLFFACSHRAPRGCGHSNGGEHGIPGSPRLPSRLSFMAVGSSAGSASAPSAAGTARSAAMSSSSSGTASRHSATLPASSAMASTFPLGCSEHPVGGGISTTGVGSHRPGEKCTARVPFPSA